MVFGFAWHLLSHLIRQVQTRKIKEGVNKSLISRTCSHFNVTNKGTKEQTNKIKKQKNLEAMLNQE